MRQYPRANPAKWWRSRAIGGAHRSPSAMFISPLRRYTSIGTLAVMVGVLGGGWYVTRPERVSRLSQILLANVLNGDVEVGEARLSLEGTLQLSGVELKTKQSGKMVRLFRADQVEMRFDWLSLLSGHLRATQITAVRPTLYLVEDQQSGKWNFESAADLSSTRSTGTQAPAIVANLPVILLREAKIQFAELRDGNYVETSATTVDGQLGPDASSPGAYRFSLQERSETPGIMPGDVTGSWQIGANSFAASANRIVLTPQLQQSLPRSVRTWWDEHKLGGELNRLRVSFDSHDGLIVSVDLLGVSMIQPIGTEQGFSTRLDIPIENVSGSLEFGVSNGRLRIKGLRGRVMGFNVNVAGEFRGTSAGAPFDLSVKLPDAHIGEYPAIVKEIPAAQDLLRRLRPHGDMSVDLNIFRSRWGDDVDVRGSVFCQDVSARFIHFPYPLEHVRGTIFFDSDLVTFKDVTAVAGESNVLINGQAGTSSSNHFTDFDVRSDNAILDNRLSTCLNTKYQNIWSQFNPTGAAKFICRVKRGREANSEQTVEVEVYPQDVRIMYVRFPYELTGVHGKLVLADEESRIEGLEGNAPGGKVTISGEVKYPNGDLEKLEATVNVKADHVDFDRKLLAALPEEYQQWTRKLETSGTATIQATVRSPVGEDLDIRGGADIQNATIRAADGTWEAHNVNAQITRAGSKMDLKQLTAETGPDGKARLTLGGQINEMPGGYQLAIQGSIDDFTLPANAPLLPEEWKKNWTRYKPAGVVDARFNVQLDAPMTTSTGGKQQSVGDWIKDYRVDVESHDVSVTPEGWPDKVDRINAQVMMTPARIEVQRISAHSDTLTVNGSGIFDRGSKITELSVRGQSNSLPLKWVAVMPAGVRNLVDQLKPQSRITFDLKQIRRDASVAQPTWSFEGDLRLNDLKTSGPLTLNAGHMALSGAGSWSDASALDFSGDLRGGNITLANRTMETFQSRIEATGARNSVAFQKMEGRIAGGVLQGNLTLTTAPDIRYEGQLVLNDADIALLALPDSATDEERRRIGTGKVTATLAVQESFAKNGDRTGRGDLVVRDGQIYNVPLSMGLLQLATLRMPMSRAFNSAQMSYYLRDQKVTFEKILLESPGVNLAGLGTLNLGDQTLDLRFVTETPNEIHLPIISGVLQGARNQLLQIQVSGPVDAPRIQPIPLDVVASTLQALLPKRRVNQP